jgi:hypothetical protein
MLSFVSLDIIGEYAKNIEQFTNVIFGYLSKYFAL